MVEDISEQIQFRCHACRQKFTVKRARIGSKFKCPKCDTVVQVPQESGLENPDASKPTVRTQTAAANSETDSRDGPSHGGLPKNTDVPGHAPAAEPEAGGRPKPPAVIPAGKKACPECAHVCPGMALACPMCQHRFEVAKPKAKPAVSEAGGATDPAEGFAEVPADVKKEVKARLAEAAKQRKTELAKDLDDAVTLRGKGVGRTVEPPLWMDEAVYGRAFKLGFAGFFCTIAAIMLFLQLDSPESARNAFGPIQWLYGVGGRWIPSLVCLAGGMALFYFAIRPVIQRIQYEKLLNRAKDPFKDGTDEPPAQSD